MASIARQWALYWAQFERILANKSIKLPGFASYGIGLISGRILGGAFLACRGVGEQPPRDPHHTNRISGPLSDFRESSDHELKILKKVRLATRLFQQKTWGTPPF